MFVLQPLAGQTSSKGGRLASRADGQAMELKCIGRVGYAAC